MALSTENTTTTETTETKETKTTKKATVSAEVNKFAIGVISGQYGTGETLKKAIADAGLDEAKVMARAKELRK